MYVFISSWPPKHNSFGDILKLSAIKESHKIIAFNSNLASYKTPMTDSPESCEKAFYFRVKS